MRYYSFLLTSLLVVNMPIHAIMMTNDGLDTGRGFIKWEQLINLQRQFESLEHQVKILRAAYIASIVLAAGAYLYVTWFKDDKKLKSTDQENAIMNDVQILESNVP